MYNVKTHCREHRAERMNRYDRYRFPDVFHSDRSLLLLPSPVSLSEVIALRLRFSFRIALRETAFRKWQKNVVIDRQGAVSVPTSGFSKRRRIARAAAEVTPRPRFVHGSAPHGRRRALYAAWPVRHCGPGLGRAGVHTQSARYGAPKTGNCVRGPRRPLSPTNSNSFAAKADPTKEFAYPLMAH
jgi:hypothetical protein